MDKNSGISKQKNLLYKIYYKADSGDDVLVYLGRTHQPLNNRLRGHFLKTPMMRLLDPRQVSKIEYAEFKTEADCWLYEIYFINKLKPSLNRDDKSKEELTVDLPPVPFQLYECPLLEKWREKVNEDNLKHERIKAAKSALIEQRIAKREEIYSSESLNSEQKNSLWYEWLESVYEPQMKKLQDAQS